MAITAKDEIKKTVGIGTENVKIPAGFKLTELDDNLNGCLFGDFFISRPAKKTISIEEYVTFLGMNDISEHGGVLRQHSIRASEVKAGLTVFERFDVLVAKITPCFENGKGACLDLLETMVGFGSTEFHVLRPKPQVVPRYIYYHTRLLNFRRQLEREMIGTAGQKRVPMKAIENYRLQVKHSYLEQQAIAAALSDIDSLITSFEQLIAKKRDIKQATMQQLLTGTQRLPGFSDKWKKNCMGEIFQFLSTANNPRSDLSKHGDIGYLHYGDIHGGTSPFLDCSKKTMPYIKLQKIKNLPFLEEGDLVIADASEDYEGIGKSVEILNINNKKVVAGLHTFLLRGNKNIVSDGFKGYIQFIPSFRKDIVRLATGISVYGISKNNLRGVEVTLPPIHEQKAIATILSDMNTEITSLEQQLDKARNLKQGMMQELLTGRIRLV